MAKEWAIGFAVLFAIATLVRTVTVGKSWRPWIPGGIAVAVGQSPPFLGGIRRSLTNAAKGCTMCRLSPWLEPSVVCLPGTGFMS